MLRLLPKGDLMLMNNEIPARHTDFHQLTDIELMNLDLIQEVLAEKE